MTLWSLLHCIKAVGCILLALLCEIDIRPVSGVLLSGVPYSRGWSWQAGCFGRYGCGLLHGLFELDLRQLHGGAVLFEAIFRQSARLADPVGGY